MKNEIEVDKIIAEFYCVLNKYPMNYKERLAIVLVFLDEILKQHPEELHTDPQIVILKAFFKIIIGL